MNIWYEIIGAAAVAVASYTIGRILERKDSAIEKWKSATEEENKANEAIKATTQKLINDDIDSLSERFFKH